MDTETRINELEAKVARLESVVENTRGLLVKFSAHPLFGPMIRKLLEK